MSKYYYLLRRKIQEEKGALVLMGFFFMAIVLLTFLPTLYTLAQLTDRSTKDTLASQLAAYSASSLVQNTSSTGRFKIDTVPAGALSEKIIRDNIGQNLQNSNINAINIWVHNPAQTVQTSMATNSNCISSAAKIVQKSSVAAADGVQVTLYEDTNNCWSDNITGSFHRTPGVSVQTISTVQVCGTWSALLLAAGQSGCMNKTINSWGFADYTYKDVEDSPVIFANPIANITVLGRDANAAWSVSGQLKNGAPIYCILGAGAGSPQVPASLRRQPCTNQDLSGNELYAGLAPGNYLFSLQVTGANNKVYTSKPVAFRVLAAETDRGIEISLKNEDVIWHGREYFVEVKWRELNNRPIVPAASSSYCTLYDVTNVPAGTKYKTQHANKVQVGTTFQNCFGAQANGTWTWDSRALYPIGSPPNYYSPAGPNGMPEGRRFALAIIMKDAAGARDRQEASWEVPTRRFWNGRFQIPASSIPTNDPQVTIPFRIEDQAYNIYDINTSLSSCIHTRWGLNNNAISSGGLSPAACFASPINNRPTNVIYQPRVDNSENVHNELKLNIVSSSFVDESTNPKINYQTGNMRINWIRFATRPGFIPATTTVPGRNPGVTIPYNQLSDGNYNINIQYTVSPEAFTRAQSNGNSAQLVYTSVNCKLRVYSPNASGVYTSAYTERNVGGGSCGTPENVIDGVTRFTLNTNAATLLSQVPFPTGAGCTTTTIKAYTCNKYQFVFSVNAAYTNDRHPNYNRNATISGVTGSWLCYDNTTDLCPFHPSNLD